MKGVWMAMILLAIATILNSIVIIRILNMIE